MIRKFQLAALVAAAFFLSTAAAAQKRDPSAWMHEIGPVAGFYGFFGAESGADAYNLELVDALLWDAKEQGSEILLLTGDLVNGGKPHRHEALAEKLRQTERTGLKDLMESAGPMLAGFTLPI